MHLKPEMLAGMTGEQRVLMEWLNVECEVLRKQLDMQAAHDLPNCNSDRNIISTPGRESQEVFDESLMLMERLSNAERTRDQLRMSLKALMTAGQMLVEEIDLDTVENTRTWCWLGTFVEALIEFRNAMHQSAQVV